MQLSSQFYFLQNILEIYNLAEYFLCFIWQNKYVIIILMLSIDTKRLEIVEKFIVFADI